MSGPEPSAHLAAIFEGTDDAIISTTLDGTVTSWNNGAEVLYGYRAAEAIGQNISLLYADDDKDALHEILARVGGGESTRLTDGTRVHRDGSSLSIELRVTPLRNDHGDIVGASAIVRDVSEWNRREQELSQSREFLERTQELAHIGGWRTMVGPEMIVQLTAEAYQILGLEYGLQIRNIDFFNLVYPDDRQLLIETFMKTRNDQIRSEFEVRIVRPDSAVRWIYVAADAVVDSTNTVTGLTGVMQDITDRKDNEASLVYDALHDQLTGLPNRFLFLDRLNQTLNRVNLRRSSKVAVLFADLDRFELFNDTQGHDLGDALLRTVAQRLREAVPVTDTVARFGADEFVFICEGIASAADAAERADLVLSHFRAPFELPTGETFITASIGVAVSESDSVADVLVRDADLAMYQAKQRGRNRYELYDLNLRQQAEHRINLEAGLRRAIDKGELFLEFQPISSLRDKTLLGAEALVRWRNPDRGVLYPDDFIDVAEETGLIDPIGAWILEEACLELRRWQDAAGTKRQVRMSINVSPGQLRQADFPDIVARAIAGARIDGSSIWLELTESILVEDAHIGDALHTIRDDLGPRLSVDDFGTKYSALSYLTRLPIDGLKLDQSFIQDAVANASNRMVISAIVTLGHSLNLHVTAEGVETQDQYDLVLSLGCDSAQGLYLSPPVSGDDCLAMLLRTDT